ncbi:MAG: hypothetical protein H6998_20705 [Hahellaceae bacterium]|nr:hypothetical protein [Hahellaceae bacterium]
MHIKTSQHSYPILLDIEASSLSDNSYPIEIAWTLPCGEIVSYLINPKTVSAWQDWSVSAEKLHGITRHMLESSGEKPEAIIKKILETPNHKVMYSDNPEWDQFWLSRLFAAARQPLDIECRHLYTLFSAEVLDSKVDGIPVMSTIEKFARNNTLSRHRAKADVRYLLNIYQAIMVG